MEKTSIMFLSIIQNVLSNGENVGGGSEGNVTVCYMRKGGGLKNL